MITLILVICIALMGIAIVLNYSPKRNTSSSFENDPIIKGKRFGGDYPIRFWAQPKDPSVRKLAEQFKSNDPMITVTKTYNWLEENYIYENDRMAIMNKGEVLIIAGGDTWLLPSEVILMKKQNGWVKVDCEDSAIIASILEAAGLKAYMNIGIIRITDLKTGQVSNYGHGFPSVILDGVEYILESTLGQPLSELKSGTVFINKEIKVEYIPYVKFNSKEVIQLIGADINSIPNPLPPARIQDLRNLLGH